MRKPPDRPNIILINRDDLGYGDPGCYGQAVNAASATDRLAGEGMLLTDFYMAARLRRVAEQCQREIYAHCRPCGCVADPVTLTQYDPLHPCIVAMYDTGGQTRKKSEMVATSPATFTAPVIGPRR
jgi:hypothetical protein